MLVSGTGVIGQPGKAAATAWFHCWRAIRSTRCGLATRVPVVSEVAKAVKVASDTASGAMSWSAQ
ncbi:hypothetical protein TSH7_28510 [Azospirillum sp. TSH7]|nr:hypothetical protein TSH20_33365 [Azospirillum sp. TSH20]PWC56313.1 hypothetical protein TSH7_28510 [Azospirillum sp. TSH7]